MFLRATRAKALAVVVAVAIAGFTLSACGNPETDVNGCSGTPPEVVAAISEKLHSNVGKLRNTHQFAKGTGGVTFITAELHDPDKGQAHDQRHDKGDLLTWSTTDIKSGQFKSVDEHAHAPSRRGRARRSTSARRARTSRAPAPTSAEARPRRRSSASRSSFDGNSPALPGNKDCGDL